MLTDPIIGHRGIASLAPENTLASLHLAAEHGVKWVELDVSIIKDNTLVLSHDFSLERCTNQSGTLMDLDAQALEELDAGSWFSDAFSGEPMPTLTQTFDTLSELGINLNLELKEVGDDHPRACKAILERAASHWRGSAPIIYSSFNHQVLEALRALDSEAQIGLLYEELKDDWRETAERIGAISIHCDWKKLTDQQIDEIKQAGYVLMIYTCNDPAEADRLWASGVDAVISDAPQTLTAPAK